MIWRGADCGLEESLHRVALASDRKAINGIIGKHVVEWHSVKGFEPPWCDFVARLNVIGVLLVDAVAIGRRIIRRVRQVVEKEVDEHFVVVEGEALDAHLGVGHCLQRNLEVGSFL